MKHEVGPLGRGGSLPRAGRDDVFALSPPFFFLPTTQMLSRCFIIRLFLSDKCAKYTHSVYKG